MIYLLLGSDDFSKREFVNELEKKERLEISSLFDATPKDILNDSKSNSLFSSKKLVKVYDFFAANTELPEGFIQSLLASGNVYIFFEQALDKRKTATKKLLADKTITVKEFNIPSGEEFKKWVVARSATYSLTFEKNALELFFERLGGGKGEFGKEMYSLWQADSELQKLSLYVKDKAVTVENIKVMVPENIEENIFRITNAIGDRNVSAATQYLNEYIDRLPGDEKAKIISLSALLADQFRNILIIQALTEQGMPEAEISSQTGFASGRLFVYKKLSRGFKKEKLIDALTKLEYLDEEMKSTSGPAALQFFMIVNGLLAYDKK
jgi:DNA polymerase III subunit delta